MTVNFAGIAGGSTIINAMGAKAAYGSWIAASYALVILIPMHTTLIRTNLA